MHFQFQLPVLRILPKTVDFMPCPSALYAHEESCHYATTRRPMISKAGIMRGTLSNYLIDSVPCRYVQSSNIKQSGAHQCTTAVLASPFAREKCTLSSLYVTELCSRSNTSQRYLLSANLQNLRRSMALYPCIRIVCTSNLEEMATVHPTATDLWTRHAAVATGDSSDCP